MQPKQLFPKSLFVILLILLLTACGVSLNGRDRSNANGEIPTPIPTVVAAARPTYEVALGDVVYEITFPGRVAPVVEQPLFFALDGAIGVVYVNNGDEVQAGDPLAELDTTAWEVELGLAQSALTIAQERLAARQNEISSARQRAELRRDLAQLDLDFAINQAGDNPTPAQQYEIDRLRLLLNLAQLDVAELDATVDPQLAADVDTAALQVAELENMIAQAVLTAPFDGVILTMNTAVGRSVLAGESIGVIADPAQIEVTANLRDDVLQELAEGFTAQITAVGGPGQTLTGHIRRLPYSFGSGEPADSDDQSVRIQFDDTAAALNNYVRGDRVNVTVLITRHEDVLWLPPAAIRDFNGRKFVVVQVGETQQRVDITLGIEGNGRVEIVEGLEAGQIIVGQ